MFAQTEKVNDSFNAGYSMYVAAYPLLGKEFSIGPFWYLDASDV
jgi:hypothetical protein